MNASVADVLRKHREALQGLLHQAWEESEKLVMVMLTSDVSGVVRDNAENLQSILYSLYATVDQWAQLDFGLPLTDEELSERRDLERKLQLSPETVTAVEIVRFGKLEMRARAHKQCS